MEEEFDSGHGRCLSRCGSIVIDTITTSNASNAIGGDPGTVDLLLRLRIKVSRIATMISGLFL